MDALDEVSDTSTNELGTPPPSPNTARAQYEAMRDAIAALIDRQERLQAALDALARRLAQVEANAALAITPPVAVVACICVSTLVAAAARCDLKTMLPALLHVVRPASALANASAP